MKKKRFFIAILLIACCIFAYNILDSFIPGEVGSKKAQAVDFDDVDNCRQLGGYKTMDGKTVKSDILFRSGKLSKLEDDGFEAFYKKNITDIIDLRIPEEVSHRPDPKLDNAKSHVINLADTASTFYMYSVLGVKTNSSNYKEILDTIAKTPMNLGEMYIEGIIDSDYGRQALKRVFSVFVNHKDGAILWHCTGGKDRTGIVAALLLSALNVDRETVLNDYELTNEFVKGQRIGMKIVSMFYSDDEKEEERVATVAGVKRDFMQNALNHIDKTYGGPIDFLKNQVGISEQDILTLRAKYLE